MRFTVFRIIIIIAFLLLAVDLFYTQIIRGDYYHNLSMNNRIRVVPLDGRRGVIYDRNGVVLADDRLSFNVTVIPQDVQESEPLFDYLSKVLKTDKKFLLHRFYQRKNTPFAPVVIAEDIEKGMAMILEENKFRFPGLFIQESFGRRYPMGEIGAHVLGYVGQIDQERLTRDKNYGYAHFSVVGHSGIEEYYDEFLRGRFGGVQIEVNSRGQQVRLLSVKEAQRGADLYLTIDARIQKAAFNALAENKGAIIVMDRDSSEILAMVSSPAFDPNYLVSRRFSKEARQYFIHQDAPLLNRAIQAIVPPGSVFKVVTSFAALSEEKIKAETSFFCKGFKALGRRSFRCSHVHGEQNLVEGIAHSCNVYFFNVGLLLGPELMYKYARFFGLGTLTHIDLPFEKKGNVPSGQRKERVNAPWTKGDTLNFSIGQGDLLITPIQALRLIATVAQNGKMGTPHLLKAIGKEEVVNLSLEKQMNLKQEYFDIVKEGLRGVVADAGGTARQLNDLEELSLSGKTGTAQTVPGKLEHAWFVGYNNQGRKNIAFCVFLEHGGSSFYAARVAKKMLATLYKQKIL